jgi:hypothetical protein
MKKLFRKIRNMFFPKKHDKLVFKIKNRQEHLKVLQVKLNKINHLAEHGILGGMLLDEQIMLELKVKAIKKDILFLKWQYQNKV